jgi:hypothetical protein
MFLHSVQGDKITFINQFLNRIRHLVLSRFEHAVGPYQAYGPLSDNR